MNHLVTFSGFQNGIQTDTTKWFTLVMRKSVESLCIYIPGTPGGPCLPSMKTNAFNLATISQQLNTILIIRDDLR